MNGRFISYLLCALLWLGCVYELVMIMVRAFRGTLQETPVIGALLTQSNLMDRAAPIAVLIISGWILIEVLLHFIRVAREFTGTMSFQTAVEGASDGEVPVQKLDQISGRSRAGRRAALIREHADNSKALHDAVPAMAALDGGTLDGAYSFVRVYTWTLPVIGFIGTAWGMSHAIGGFSDALKETSEVATLTARLSQLVIPGLANAFSTTILALLAAVIAHFCSTVLQTGEQMVLNDLDQASVRLLAKLPRGEDFGGGGGFKQVVGALQSAAEALTRLDLGRSANELNQAAGALKEAANEIGEFINKPYHVTITRENQ